MSVDNKYRFLIYVAKRKLTNKNVYEFILWNKLDNRDPNKILQMSAFNREELRSMCSHSPGSPSRYPEQSLCSGCSLPSMCVCVCLCVSLCLSACVYMCVFAYTYVCVYIHIGFSVCMCLCVYTHVFMCVCM